MEVTEVAKLDSPGPSSEDEIDNPYKYIFAGSVFHPFPKLPLEVRDMIWGYCISLTTSPSIVLMDAKHPTAPLLTHVCHEARAACLKIYSAFRDAILVWELASIPIRDREGYLDLTAPRKKCAIWIDFERDMFYMNIDVFRMLAGRTNSQRRIGNIYKHRLADAKELAFSIYDANKNASEYCEFWQTLSVFCPKLTGVTIFTNSAEICDERYDFRTASRELQRIKRKSMNRALCISYYDKLRSSLIDCSSMNYKVNFAELELNLIPNLPAVTPEPEPQHVRLTHDEEITDEELLLDRFQE